jgi:hypothetical protein
MNAEGLSAEAAIKMLDMRSHPEGGNILKPFGMGQMAIGALAPRFTTFWRQEKYPPGTG